MSLYKIEQIQNVPIPIEEAWDFFSNPANLAKLTPKDIGFEITSNIEGGKMYAGQVLTYNVSPIAGIKMSWATEILQVNAPHHFIDDQLTGPYKIWHHQHHFRPIEGGTEIKDIVHYALPWYALGALGHSLIVKPKLREIFDYRIRRVEEIFGEM
jgi:ligand-binding SRPBCC domain-containing protein